MDIKNILFGAVSGAIFGLVMMLALGGTYDLLITPAILGGLISFLMPQLPDVGFWAAAAIIGAGFFAISALISGYMILDHAISGAVTGLLIAAIMKFVTPKILKG